MASPTVTLPHLAARANDLPGLGWRGRDAEWIALVCLHSGVFVRSQFCHHYQCDRATALRFVRRLTDARTAKQHPLPDTRTNQQFCHIHGKSFYRTLGIPDVRHRRRVGDGVLWRRLLSLDAVLEHPALPWLPTEPDKVHYFTGLGIDPELLPRRVYAGRNGTTTRAFAWKLPIAGDAGRAVFVYVDAGLATTRQLRRWCAEHAPLWAALRASAIEVHVHAVARTVEADARNAAFLQAHQATPSAAQPLSADEANTLAQLDAALEARDHAALRRWGGFIDAGIRAASLRARAAPPDLTLAGHIDQLHTHVASRVADDVYAA
ncbi:MAG: hypothetical protein OXN18_15460 [Gemmatimonadota bacterium]|nr:hypothetical protein [Gemmatimonadota bacterium]